MLRLTSTRSGQYAPPVIVAFEQQWDGRQLNVRYYLFDTASAAQKVAANGGTWRFARPPNCYLERNPKEVIGDVTWHYRPRRQGDHDTHIVFVQNNVLVHITASGDPSSRLQFARDVARKIEAKVASVLSQK